MDTTRSEPAAPTDDTAEALEAALGAVRGGFAAQPAPSLAERRAWLRTLRSLLLTHQQAFADAIAADFGTRSPIETRGAEVMVTLGAIDWLHRHLPELMADEDRHTNPLFAPARVQVLYQPRGVIGIISPWNYPLQLALVPLATALAAGNTAMLKPSELTPRTSALLRTVLHDAYPPDRVRVALGGPDVGAAFAALRFDHLFFTGSTAVGRLVMQAAARNLTPVTLELGGKSPAIVHPGADLSIAAERIAFGKCLNAGQTCVAPDYALVPRALEADFVRALSDQIRTFYPDPARNPDYTSIITPRHLARLQALVADAASHGAEVTALDDDAEALAAAQKLAPTLLQGTNDAMTVMREEIFGPILPIVPYDDLDQALAYVNARPRPLALYYFDRSGDRIDRVLRHTHAGGVCVNDVLLHLAQDDLPFGGVGESGMGSYHGREGFVAMSHAKAVFHQRRVRFTQLFNPPYGRTIRTLLRGLVR